MALDDHEVRDRVAHIDALLERLESLADPAARSIASDTVHLLLELYGEGLARVMAHLARTPGPELSAALAGDELVSHLLLVHGLHPVALEARVAGALENVRAFLQSRGADVRLVGIEDRVVRLRVEPEGGASPSQTRPLERAIEQAVRSAAPDLDGIHFEPVPSTTFIPLAAVARSANAPPDEHGSQSV